MIKKLTLTVDEELIKFARQFSVKNKVSISALFSSYLEKLRLNKAPKDESLSEKTRSLYGIFSGTDLPDKKKMRKIFHEKSIN